MHFVRRSLGMTVGARGLLLATIDIIFITTVPRESVRVKCLHGSVVMATVMYESKRPNCERILK